MRHLSLLLLLVITMMFPQLLFAHGDETHMTVTLNGEPTIPNDISQTASNTKFMQQTEDLTSSAYEVNTPIVLDVSHAESSHAEFSWNFSDGQVLTGERVEKTFIKPGMYTLNLIANDSGEIQNHTILIPIVPYENYQLPQAEILLFGTPLVTNKPVEINLNEPITLSAKKAENKQYTYLWKFDNGDIQKGQSVTYEYKDKPFLATPILRVTDENGIYTDMQVSLKNTAFGKTQTGTSLYFATGGILVILAIGILGLVILKRGKK